MKKSLRKWYFILFIFLLCCSHVETKDFITVVSREASSGTRTAFDHFFGLITSKGPMRTDILYQETIICGSSSSISMLIAQDPMAIGYTSLATIGKKQKVVSIDGIVPSEQTIFDGTYTCYRPFLFVIPTNSALSFEAEDFIRFVTSIQGQKVITNAGCAPIKTFCFDYHPLPNLRGRVVLSGSTSVEPVLTKLEKSYKTVQPHVQLEVQYTGSTAGLQDVVRHKAHIGLSSRDLVIEEVTHLQAIPFAYDAIVVIVNSNNPVQNLSKEQVQQIFSGQMRTWSQVIPQEQGA